MKRMPGLSGIFIGVCITAACSLWPAQPPAPQVHDFGPPPVVNDHAAADFRLDSVRAPAWLANDNIHYRLVYQDPTALRNYADHRWAAPPAELIAARLQDLLSVGSADYTGTHDAYVLRVNLLEFEQDFSTEHDAQVHLELDVSMRRSNDGQIIAQRRFVLSQATTPDVRGAISGLAQTAGRAAAAVSDWARTQAHE
ncbi:MAG: ABC-type transport auxiliary lipoprotein family protein [Gammaproteobacteria bacterium]